MNQHISREPEYILEESEKTLLTESQRVCLNQILLGLEVDLVVLSKELIELGVMSTDITAVIRKLRLQGLATE